MSQLNMYVSSESVCNKYIICVQFRSMTVNQKCSYQIKSIAVSQNVCTKSGVLQSMNTRWMELSHFERYSTENCNMKWW